MPTPGCFHFLISLFYFLFLDFLFL